MMTKLSERSREVIWAGALGDAFGYVVEFTSWSAIVSMYGEKGFTWQEFLNAKKFPKWEVSDDTQMTLFGLEAFSMKPSMKLGTKDFYKAYQDWHITQTGKVPFFKKGSKLLQYKELYVRQAPGMTCLNALQSGEAGTWSNPINTSKGCGGIMRAAPAGICATSLVEAFELGCVQALVTHGHPGGVLPSGWMSALLYVLVNNEQSTFTSWDALLRKIAAEIEVFISKLPPAYKDAHAELYDKLCTTLTLQDLTPSTLVRHLGEGWVGDEALFIALYAAADASSWDEMLWISTNHNGDSDSTASLAAQLWVARHGLPEEVKPTLSRLDAYKAIRDLLHS